jgi:vitamin B12 transporter
MIPPFLNPGSSKLKLILKTVIFYSTLLFSLHLQGQISLSHDTILIKEVEIRGKTIVQDNKGYKTTHIDSSLIGDYSQRTLADLIAENSLIYIKTYGSGGLATPSFRGTGSGHTQITWNNINLNNPMIGQSDLSLVPAGFIDGINIYYGGGSMSIHSGGFGGVIDLETKPDWNDQNVLSVNPGAGSFGRHSGLLKVKAGNASFQSVTKAFFKNSENNFRYLNSISGQVPYYETRENSEVRQRGFIQELYFRNSRSTCSGRLWYQSASRNLPVPITSPTMNPSEKQYDESLRAMFTYGYLKGLTDLDFTAAFISDKLEYTNKLASVNSRNSSRRIILKSDIESRINKILKVDFALNNELNIVNTNNYAGVKVRNIASAHAMAEADIARWLVARLLIREMLQDHNFLSPDFSACGEIKPFREKYYFIKASFSKNSKIPTLNDMYWSPGGNPDLKNERGYSSEITWEMTNIVSNSLRIKNDLTFFRNHLYNMIQWHPGNFSYWEADNVSTLRTQGLESSVDINFSTSALNLRLNAGYSYTRATDEGLSIGNLMSTGRQLVYIPVNQINALLRLGWRQFYATITNRYTGRRFLTADNSQYLPHYSVSDLNLGLKLKTLHTSCDLGFIIENLFDASFQNIAYYPMPGRSYLVSIIFQLKK